MGGDSQKWDHFNGASMVPSAGEVAMIVLAVVALLFSISLIFLPILGGYLTPLPTAMVFWLRGRGYGPALATVGVNLLNVLLFSPILRQNVLIGFQKGDVKWTFIFLLLIGLQLAAGWFLFTRNRPLSMKAVGPVTPPTRRHRE